MRVETVSSGRRAIRRFMFAYLDAPAGATCMLHGAMAAYQEPDTKPEFVLVAEINGVSVAMTLDEAKQLAEVCEHMAEAAEDGEISEEEFSGVVLLGARLLRAVEVLTRKAAALTEPHTTH